jgi:hypothetical protein
MQFFILQVRNTFVNWEWHEKTANTWKKAQHKQTKSISTQILIVNDMSEITSHGGWSLPMPYRGVSTKRRSLIGAGHATRWSHVDQLDVFGDICWVCLRWPFFPALAGFSYHSTWMIDWSVIHFTSFQFISFQFISFHVSVPLQRTRSVWSFPPEVCSLC